MNNSIKLEYDKEIDYWVITYKTLDIVTQGKTKEEAKLMLLDVLTLYIDFAIENDNMECFVPEHLKKI